MNTDNDKVKKSLRYSFLDGVFASGMSGFTQEYFTPFLLVLGGTVKHVGMLTAVPNLFASLIQSKSPDITEKLKSRKKIINIFVLLQAFMLLPMAAMAFFTAEKPVYFIAIVALFTSFGAIANPAWGSLMSDLIAEDKRGAYFGWRNRVLGFILVGAAFIAGFILHLMKKINIFYGFVAIFSFAFVFRVISWYFLKRMHEPPVEYKESDYFSFLDFISRLRQSNFAKFVIFISMMSFSVNLCSPYFSVLMLKDLHFSYLVYSLVIVTATLTIYLSIGRWGRHADKIGNLKVIKFTSPLIGFIPLFWVVNRHPAFLCIAQVFSGFVWAGFNLCATNFIYDAVTPPKRTRCIAYFNVFNGLALCGGAITGGFLLRYLPPLFGYKILTLFLISSILRILIGFIVPIKLKEVRAVQDVSSNQLFFSVIGIKPLLGIERRTIGY